VTEAEAGATDDQAVHALVFRAGFSTSEQVSETSGRGVGLDVVQDAVRRAGGAVEVSSAPGRGTAFALTMPLSAAIAPVLLVEVAGHTYALPAARVEAVVDGAAGAAERTAAGVVCLARLVGLPAAAEEAGSGVVVVVRQSGGRRVGLAVGRVQRRTDLLLRPLHPALAALPAVGGVGVLGNGEPVVVLEPDGIPLA
jgi:two-component system chemotaxis sensor kinase CheA